MFAPNFYNSMSSKLYKHEISKKLKALKQKQQKLFHKKNKILDIKSLRYSAETKLKLIRYLKNILSFVYDDFSIFYLVISGGGFIALNAIKDLLASNDTGIQSNICPDFIVYRQPFIYSKTERAIRRSSRKVQRCSKNIITIRSMRDNDKADSYSQDKRGSADITIMNKRRPFLDKKKYDNFIDYMNNRGTLPTRRFWALRSDSFIVDGGVVIKYTRAIRPQILDKQYSYPTE
jgi:hypothetical protein